MGWRAVGRGRTLQPGCRDAGCSCREAASARGTTKLNGAHARSRRTHMRTHTHVHTHAHTHAHTHTRTHTCTPSCPPPPLTPCCRELAAALQPLAAQQGGGQQAMRSRALLHLVQLLQVRVWGGCVVGQVGRAGCGRGRWWDSCGQTGRGAGGFGGCWLTPGCGCCRFCCQHAAPFGSFVTTLGTRVAAWSPPCHCRNTNITGQTPP